MDADEYFKNLERGKARELRETCTTTLEDLDSSLGEIRAAVNDASEKIKDYSWVLGTICIVLCVIAGELWAVAERLAQISKHFTR